MSIRRSTATRSTRRRRCSTSASSSTKPDRGIVTVETRAFNQRGERVCIFKRRVMVPKREAGELQPPDIPAGAD